MWASQTSFEVYMGPWLPLAYQASLYGVKLSHRIKLLKRYSCISLTATPFQYMSHACHTRIYSYLRPNKVYWAIYLMHRRFHLMRRRREIFDFRSFLMLSNLSCSAKYFLIESKHLEHKYPDSYSLPDSFVLVSRSIKTPLQRCDVVLASCVLFVLSKTGASHNLYLFILQTY